MALEKDVATHYSQADLCGRILAGLEQAGLDIDRLTPEDLAPIDEFHVRGREATMELGRGLGLSPDLHVLDVGSGVGGPARHLATAYGCRITGIDLTEDYCEAANMLAGRVGLDDKVSYRPANALDMPFERASFDAAYTQHVAMNIPDKAALYREVARVLKPGAGFGIYDVLKGPGGDIVFPTPWARDPTTSFVATEAEMRDALGAAGLTIESWRDTTDLGKAWFAATQQRIAEQGPPPLGFHLLLGPIFAEMRKNQARNLAEDRVAMAEIICRKP